jgi:WD40 repeat protein
VFAPDGRRILTASADGTARLWDRDGKPLAILQGHTGEVTSAVFAPSALTSSPPFLSRPATLPNADSSAARGSGSMSVLASWLRRSLASALTSSPPSLSRPATP